MVDKRSLAAVPLRGVPSERSGLGTQRLLRGQDPGNKRSQRPPPSSTLEMLPLDGALAHLRPTACKTGRVPVSTRQLAKGKSNRSSFPQAPPRARGPGAPRPTLRGSARRPGAEERARSGASRAAGRAGGAGGRRRGGRRPGGGKDAPRPHPSARRSRQRVVGRRALLPSLRPHRARSRAAPGRAAPAAARGHQGRRGAGTRRGRRSDHDRFVQQAAGLVQGPVLEGGDGAHAGRAAVLRQDHLRQRDRGTAAGPEPPPRRAERVPARLEARGLARPRGPGGARPGRDGTEGAGGRGTGDAAQARDWRLRGCHEARGTAARGDGPPSAPQPGA